MKSAYSALYRGVFRQFRRRLSGSAYSALYRSLFWKGNPVKSIEELEANLEKARDELERAKLAARLAARENQGAVRPLNDVPYPVPRGWAANLANKREVPAMIRILMMFLAEEPSPADSEGASDLSQLFIARRLKRTPPSLAYMTQKMCGLGILALAHKGRGFYDYNSYRLNLRDHWYGVQRAVPDGSSQQESSGD